jgi:4-hydroxy-2-oxoglutarate aldolase
MGKFSLKGAIPPMITPFTAKGDVDYEAFAANIEAWNKTRLCGYLVTGSNSETAFLTEAEKLELVRLTAKHAAPGRAVIAGTGVESLRETIRFTNLCAEAGAQSALVLTPNFYDNAMDTPVLVNFFTKLADASPIPILIYNVSKYTHVNIKADALAVLCKHPNVVGMKDSNGDVPQLATFLRTIEGQDFQLMTGTASAWYPALTMGIKAAVMALSNCNPTSAPWCRRPSTRAIGRAAENLSDHVPGQRGRHRNVRHRRAQIRLRPQRLHGGFVREPLLSPFRRGQEGRRENRQHRKEKLAAL